jgi:hypothetical protein
LQNRKELANQIEEPGISLRRLKHLVQELDACYSRSYGAYRPEAADAHNNLADALQRTIRSVHDRELIEKSIHERMVVLESMAVAIQDWTKNGPTKNTRRSLPIAVDRAPYNSENAVVTCLRISEAFCFLGDAKRAERWIRAAIWSELLPDLLHILSNNKFLFQYRK